MTPELLHCPFCRLRRQRRGDWGTAPAPRLRAVALNHPACLPDLATALCLLIVDLTITTIYGLLDLVTRFSNAFSRRVALEEEHVKPQARKQRPRMSDIARLAGVSRTTVSFVLNNH